MEKRPSRNLWRGRQPRLGAIGDYSWRCYALRRADATAAKASDGAAIAAKPTHVVIAPVTVRAAAEATGIAVTDLAPGTQVTLVQTANGWTIISRDGKKLGYVKADALVGLQ